MIDINGKTFSVLGLGKSGYWAAALLIKKGGKVFLSESGDNEQIREYAKKLEQQGAIVEIGKHSVPRITAADKIVISPGISPKSKILQALEACRDKWVSEVDVASWFCPGKIIAITGTNGKTTVTTLTEKLLNVAGFHALRCGNIGIPFSEVVDSLSEESFAVVELSSFQLYYSQSLKPPFL